MSHKNHLPHSVSVAFFGILLIVSLAFNVYAFQKMEATTSSPFSTTSSAEVALPANATKVVKDGKVWIQLQDPIFDAYILADSSCSVCADLSPAKNEIEKIFPTAEIKEIDVNSEKGKELLSAGVTVLPAIVFGEQFKNVSAAQQAVQSGMVTPIEKSGYFEFRTSGNKKILSEKQLPAVPADMKKVPVIAYTNFFSPESAEFSEMMPQIAAQYGDALAVQNRIFVSDIPSSYVAQALVCGVDQEKVAKAQEEFTKAINDILAENGEKEITKEVLDDISDELANILHLRGEKRDCYEKREFATAAVAAAAEAQSLGITGSPAYFVGNRFLAGKQSPEIFISAIEEVLAEKGISQPASSPEAPEASSSEDMSSPENTEDALTPESNIPEVPETPEA